MSPFFYKEEAGAKGLLPLSPAPPIPAGPPPLRFGPSPLTIPNTCSTINVSASLRSDCCSPSLRNAVRLPSGIDVHLHRNTHHAVRRTAHVHERLRSAGKLAPELFDAAEKFRMDFERSGARFTHSLLEKTRNLGCSGKRRLIGREGAEESTRSGFDPVATASNSAEVYRPPTARAVRSSGCRIRLDKKQSHGAAVGSASPKPGRRDSG